MSTRGLRAACGPLDKLVRPFLLLSSFILFLRAKKILRRKNISVEADLAERGRKNISGEADLAERGRKNIGRDRILACIAGEK